MQCRVCGSPTAAPIFHSLPRSIVGIRRPIDASLTVSACGECGHAQSDDIDFEKFYGHEYRFQLASRDHDELHSVVAGVNVFRSDLQARIAVKLINTPQGAKVLDYGGGKAATLKKICTQRPDLVPHVFDVSSDYVPLWREWIPPHQQATYRAPVRWHSSFDVVLAFFVLEHVAEPNQVLREIADLLLPGGTFICAVPNPLENFSDFVVVEHVSHFTRSSLSNLLRQHGFAIERYASEEFFGSHVLMARKGATTSNAVLPDPRVEHARLRAVADFWARAQDRIRAVARQIASRPCAIYGAGVYGSYIATRLEGRSNLFCFVDRNPHLWGRSEFGIPIVAPDELPDEVEVVFAGVNPINARAILADVPEWRGRLVQIVYLDQD